MSASRDFTSTGLETINFGQSSAINDFTDYTICFWVDPDNLSSGRESFAQKLGGVNTGWTVLVGLGPPVNFLYLKQEYNTTDALAVVSSPDIAAAGWHFVCFTHNASTKVVKYYYDGVEVSYVVSTAGATTQGLETTADLYIGNSSSGDSCDARIAFFHYYNRLLTLDEMNELMWKPGSIVNNLQLYSPLWGDSPEVDLSGNGASGTVTGATASVEGPSIQLSLGCL